MVFPGIAVIGTVSAKLAAKTFPEAFVFVCVKATSPVAVRVISSANRSSVASTFTTRLEPVLTVLPSVGETITTAGGVISAG